MEKELQNGDKYQIDHDNDTLTIKNTGEYGTVGPLSTSSTYYELPDMKSKFFSQNVILVIDINV